MKKVRKAVIPAAGFGTRMLPFTKAVPKELIPLVDKPVIQYVVEEAVSAGIEEILIIISAGKEAIIRHFNPICDLNDALAARGKNDLLCELSEIDKLAKISYVYQQLLNGLGDAVLLAENFVGNEPFALLLGDTVLKSTAERSVTGQLIDVYGKFGSSVVAVEKVPAEKFSRYGIVGGVSAEEGVIKIENMVEKPAPENAPGDLAVASRYLFTPGIFRCLAETAPGLNGEIQLTDAMRKLLKTEAFYGRQISGKRYDIGSKAGFVAANIEFALERNDIGADVADKIKEILKEKNL